jgi:hypothetical protein
MRAGRQVAFYISPGYLGLAVEGCRPSSRRLKDKRHRWIYLLKLLMSETGPCL